jgi:hypothetical protein
MKKVFLNLSVFGLLSFFFTACTKTDAPIKPEAYEQTQAGAKSKLSQEPINFTAPMVFPEGVVYDASNDRFLVSSISMGTIGAVSREGIYSSFIQDADLASTAGMEIDNNHNRLVVTSSREMDHWLS